MKSTILLEASLDEFLKQEALAVLCLQLSFLWPEGLGFFFPLVRNLSTGHPGLSCKNYRKEFKTFYHS